MRFIFIIITISTFGSTSGKWYRLPTDIKPTFYTIKLHPNLDTETFKGHVSIHFRVKSFTDSIAFHSSGLNITSLYLNTHRVHYIADVLNHTLYYTYEDYDLIKIRRKDTEQIYPGSYIVYIKYTGEFSKSGSGLFKATFSKGDTVLSHLAVTDFEPTHARSVFPCFDEPGFKAKFKITIVTHNSSYFALSNMRATHIFETSEGKVFKFETTPVMSTYLVAFAVTKHKNISQKCDGVDIRSFSYHHEDLNTKVTEWACRSLIFYNTYTGYCNVLSKIDFIEYDRVESAGTENWGLITLKTGVLGKDEEYYGEVQKVNIITHEIAHFWFGNLVTNEWWNDIWLQEGFAVFIALKAEEHILKNDATETFYVQLLEDSIYPLDIENKSNPIVHFAQKPSKIRDNFNDITYMKGAALLLMIEKVLGERTLQEAICYYIKKYASKAPSTNNFISVLESFSPYNMDLRGFMESYLYQNTYPVVHVTENDHAYVLRQSSCSTMEKSSESPYGYKWTMPLTYKTNKFGTNISLIWFDKDVETLKIPKKNESWIRFNPGKTGLYRVNYSNSIWEKFINHHEDMDIYEKSNLYMEAAHLFTVDVVSCEVALGYFKRLTGKNVSELPFEINEIVGAHIRYIRRIRSYDKRAYECFTNYFVSVLKYFNQLKPSELDESGMADYLLGDLEDNEIEKHYTPSGNVKSCISWIFKNFSSYCKN